MAKTRLALIGANGNVGRELCFLFREDPEIEIIPVVRNVFGAALLQQYGIECSIGDICKPEDAKRLTRDADGVLIAAYSRGAGRRETEINKAIVQNSIQFLRPGATAIYLSTVRVFGRTVDPTIPVLGLPSRYTLRKRQCESLFMRMTQRMGQMGYVFRLGHVFGVLQPRTQDLKDMLDHQGIVRIAVDGGDDSNVVHTVALKDAVKAVLLRGVSTGKYSLVNKPQWTWKEVFDHYKGRGTTIVFTGLKRPKRKPPLSKILAPLQQILYTQRERWDGLRAILPDSYERWLEKMYWVKGYKQMSSLGVAPNVISWREFGFAPMPGNMISQLNETRSLLSEYDAIPKSMYVQDEVGEESTSS